MSQNKLGVMLEGRLWGAADELRANSKLKASEYSVPVLGLIFLRYADHKFTAAEKELGGRSSRRRKGTRFSWRNSIVPSSSMVIFRKV